MRWSLQLLPYELWSNTTRGSKIFVTKAEYRVSAFRMRCKHAASLLIFTASSQCHGSSWCATMHPAAPSPGPTGTALSGHRQLLRALAGWLGGHDAPRSSGGRAHHALYRPASLARCRASNCASAFAMAR